MTWKMAKVIKMVLLSNISLVLLLGIMNGKNRWKTNTEIHVHEQDKFIIKYKTNVLYGKILLMYNLHFDKNLNRLK